MVRRDCVQKTVMSERGSILKSQHQGIQAAPLKLPENPAALWQAEDQLLEEASFGHANHSFVHLFIHSFIHSLLHSTNSWAWANRMGRILIWPLILGTYTAKLERLGLRRPVLSMMLALFLSPCRKTTPSGLQFLPLRWQDWTSPPHQTVASLIIAVSDSTSARAIDSYMEWTPKWENHLPQLHLPKRHQNEHCFQKTPSWPIHKRHVSNHPAKTYGLIPFCLELWLNT